MLITGVDGRPGQVACPLQRTCRVSRLHAPGKRQQARRVCRLHAVGGSQQHWGCSPDTGAWHGLQDRFFAAPWRHHSTVGGQETVDQAAWEGPSAAWKPQGREATGEPWWVGRSAAAWAPIGRATAWRPHAAVAEGAPAQRQGLGAVAWAAWEAQAEAQAAGQRAAADAVRERLARGAALEAAEAAKARLAALRQDEPGPAGRGAALEAAEAEPAQLAASQHGGLGWAGVAGSGVLAGSASLTPGSCQAWAQQAAGAAAEGVQGARDASGRTAWRAERAGGRACAAGVPAVEKGVSRGLRAGGRVRRVEGWAAPRSEADEEVVEALQARAEAAAARVRSRDSQPHSGRALLMGSRGADPRAQLWRKVSGLAALAEQLAAARGTEDSYAPAARDRSHYDPGPHVLTAQTTLREVTVDPPATWGDPPQIAKPYARPARRDLLRGRAGAHAPALGTGLPLPGSVHVRRVHAAEQPEAWAGGAGAAHSGRRAPASVAGWGGRARIG